MLLSVNQWDDVLRCLRGLPSLSSDGRWLWILNPRKD